MTNIPYIYFQKVRTWGVRGIVNYFLNNLRNRRLRRFFVKNATNHPYIRPMRGVTILANFHSNLSLSKVMRDFAFCLRDAGIPYQTFDYGASDNISPTDVNPVMTPVDEFQIMKYDHVIDMFSSPLPKDLCLKQFHVVFWEFESGLLEAFPQLASFSTVIAMSDFSVENFRTQLPAETPVCKVLYPFRFEQCNLLEPVEIIRARYGISQNDFVVFFNFDFGSSVFRKNPDGVIKAFAKAFPDARNTRLVFKTNRSWEYREEQERLCRLAEKLEISDRYLAIDNYIPQRDLYGLTNACDVYISLHRGEGFGLGIAEAMSLGKPVIVTNYSATREFCKSNNSILIPYQMVDIQPGMIDHPCYLAVKSCAEPDLDSAADALRHCYNNPAFREVLGAKAKAYVEEHFSIENFKESIDRFLSTTS